MAKRKITKKNSPVKDFFKEFLKKSVEASLSLIKSINVPKLIKNISHLKSTIRKYALVMVLSVTALTVLMLGIASYISSQFPGLSKGVIEILIGLILAISAFAYYKMK